MSDCFICKIVRRDIESRIVFEDKYTISFFPDTPEVRGHTIISPKEHYSDLFDIPEDILFLVTATAKKLSSHYRKVLRATGVNLLHASGQDAQQSVFHFHIHLLPRFKNDDIDAWPKLPGDSDNVDELHRILQIDKI